MFLRKTGEYLMERSMVMTLLVLISACAPVVGVPLLFSVATVLMGLVTLRRGPWQGAWLLLMTTLPAVVGGWQLGTSALLLHFVILGSLPVWCLASLLHVSGQWRVALQATAVLGMLAVWLGGHDFLARMQPVLQPLIESKLKLLSDQGALPLTAESLKRWADAIVLRMPGLWFLLALGSGALMVLLARVWQSVLYNPGGARPELYAIRVDRWFALAFMLLLALMFTGSVGLQNMCLVAVLPFLAAGLSVVHAVASKAGRWSALAMVFFYVIALFVPQVVLLCLLLTALLDAFVNIRKVWRVTIEQRDVKILNK